MTTVNTTKGEMDDTDPRLSKKEGGTDNEAETSTWVEYWMDDANGVPELIHRSAHVTLKPQAAGGGAIGEF